jgi:hypothetical protein
MTADAPERGDQFRHPDGTYEVVFHVEDDRVLTVREYPTDEAYRDATGEAAFEGVNEDVLDLPGPNTFETDD